MKLNYKKLILVLILILLIINLSSTNILSVYMVTGKFHNSFLDHENYHPFSINEIFYEMLRALGHRPEFILIAFPLIIEYFILFFASWIIYILNPILSIIPENLITLFIIIWIVLNSSLFLIILWKMELLWKKNGIKIIILTILLILFFYSGMFFHLLNLYLIYLIASWLSNLKPIK